MIEGLRAVRLQVPDLALGRQWYNRALQVEPYASDDDSVTYFLDGYLLTLKSGAASPEDGTVAYWGVDDLATEYRRLLDIGSAPYQPLQELDAVTRTAAVLDPFGNVFGILERKDPAVLRARTQRVAEKVAIRNVREVLDDLDRDEQRKRTAVRLVLVLVGLGIVLAGMFFWDLVAGRSFGTEPQKLLINRPPR